MYSLISDCIVIQTFHDIDFSTHRPGSIYREHPDGWPLTTCTVQFGAYFEASVAECFFSFGVDSSGQIGCCIIGLAVIDDASQHHIAVTHVETGIEVGHIVIPV